MRINLVSFLEINWMAILMKLKISRISSKIWSITSPKMLSSDSFNFSNKFTMILMQQISSQLKDTKSFHFAQEIFNLVLILWSILKAKLKLSSFASIRKHKKCSFCGISRSFGADWLKWSNGLLKTKIHKKVTNNLILGLMLQTPLSEKRKN